MNFKEMFGDAEWIGTGNDKDIPIIRDVFEAKKGEKAEITIIGFGVFILYINGVRVHNEECLPLATDFEENDDMPRAESLAHRVYPEQFDISPFLVDGENVISVILGNGWYNKPIWEERLADGNKKVCYCIDLGEGEQAREFFSCSKTAKWYPSPVTDSHYNKGEEQDLRLPFAEGMLQGYKGDLYPVVKERDLRGTVYLFSDCPRDKKIRSLEPKVIIDRADTKIYDFGINTTGYPIVKCRANEGELIQIYFAEALNDEQTDLLEATIHDQRFHIIDNGKGAVVRPYFGWIAARYAKVIGNADIIGYDEVHADVKVNSAFESDNSALNYLYNVFIHTQLINMHTGIPSDCPQLERRGYTGDGQLICHSAMMMIDSKSFYRKWLYDISDCQDRNSGHVQYTAPYTFAGGGPGGWGSAIVSVPYEFYKRFADKGPMEEMYEQMHKFIDYCDTHSEYGLLTHDKDGLWCLGDWCTPDTLAIPAPFVNNYFYIKSCEKMIEIARILGKIEDIGILKEKIKQRRRATAAAYYDPWMSSCLGGIQGADAFALDMGIGDEKTVALFIQHYEQLGHYDTGIFGTEVVTRLLFEYGRGDIAIKLIGASEPNGFGRFMKLGYTTIPEYWGKVSRSRCHPMFGSPSAFLFDYVLGIQMREGTVGYEDVIIRPSVTSFVKNAKGYITAANGGRISVEYHNEDGQLSLHINIPKECKAELAIGEQTFPLSEGENKITVDGQ